MTRLLHTPTPEAERAQRRLNNVADAIEAFTRAIITHERRGDRAAVLDVDETREHLRDKLAELVNL